MLNYNAPIDGQQASIDVGNNSTQMNMYFWIKKSLITARKEQYFSQLASTTQMPKHMGKQIKVYEYVPLLDDRNINDQGIDANGVKIVNGNLYGSSKDIGSISGKIPTLTENGGRVNRVGFSRLEHKGSMFNLGFFYEFTKDSIDFDSDDQLLNHLSTETINGAVQMSEAILQKDLLSNAGVVVYSGAATSVATLTGEGDNPSVISYQNLMRLDQILTDNRTPKQTTIISGSRYIDTKVVGATRVMYVGSEVVPILKAMKDLFGNKAFIELQHYASAGSVLTGEIGSIDAFRIIQVPEMLHWAAKGAEATATNPGYRASVGDDGKDHYDVFPLLVVGDQSFTTIGFQTDGKSAKFDIKTKMPGIDTATREDPYGKTGFSSISWWYGFLALRPERIAVAKTVAPV